ncbi:MAG TPA: phosphoadenosine phosphosulfate reductase family protein, partial [Gemmataceae bacterium]|nr:phosphoadenosine phosphosulfate reductase family protein [Gemmataceae bacterium]
VKVNPLLTWTKKDVWAFIARHAVPYNPLHDQGYPSIGCWPCTRPVAEGDDERAGRWAGTTKKECGLHVIEHQDGSGI